MTQEEWEYLNESALEAKVKFYEEMIAKSNFAPFVEKENKNAISKD